MHTEAIFAWEQRKLGDVVEDYVEKTTVEDQYPVLTSSQRKGIVLQDDFFAGDRVNQNGNIGYFIIPRGYFAFRSRSDNELFLPCIQTKGSRFRFSVTQIKLWFRGSNQDKF